MKRLSKKCRKTEGSSCTHNATGLEIKQQVQFPRETEVPLPATQPSHPSLPICHSMRSRHRADVLQTFAGRRHSSRARAEEARDVKDMFRLCQLH